MKRTPLTRKTPLNRKQPSTTAPLTPGKRPRKQMKRRRSKPRKWVDLTSRKAAYQGKRCAFGVHGIRSCGNMATDPEHIFGRGFHGADHERCILPLCRSCHEWVKRSRAAKILGVWVKLTEIRFFAGTMTDIDGNPFPGVIEDAIAAYRRFIELESGSRFRFSVIESWLTDGTLLTEDVRRRANEVLDWIGE